MIPAFAFTALVLPLGSWHADQTHTYNERNPGLIAEVRVAGDRYLAGAMRNSFNRRSHLLMRDWSRGVVPGVRAGVTFGVCDGYKNTPVCGYAYAEVLRHGIVGVTIGHETRKPVLIAAWRQELR